MKIIIDMVEMNPLSKQLTIQLPISIDTLVHAVTKALFKMGEP